MCKLELKANYLSVRQHNSVNRILIDEIDTLIIETPMVSLTVALLIELTQKKVNVIFCDNQHNPHSVAHSLYGSHNTSDRVRQQVKWHQISKDSVWKKIVERKIYHQKEVLKHFGLEQYKMLEDYMSDVEDGDSTNREGHAAKVYFNAAFGKDFSRKDDRIENACLNYGYSILLSLISREIVSLGCITQLGIHHDNQFNPFNLACDFMEPIRPLIDYIVIKNSWADMNAEAKNEIVSFVNYKVSITSQSQFLTNAVRIYCKSLIDVLAEEEGKEINFINYELQNYENNCNV